VLMGCSKRGSAVCIAAGVDPRRVAGVMATCYPGGNHLNILALKYYSFGPDIGGPAEERTGPGYQSARNMLKVMNNPLGFRNLMAFDPYLWRDQIKPAFLVAIGTNDEFYGLGAPNEMLAEMPGDKAFLAVDNLPHSWVSEKHLAAWRMWLAKAFFGREIPSVTVSTLPSDDVLAITVETKSESPVEHVKLFYATNPTTDWRFIKWQSVVMKAMYGSYVGELQRKADEHLAYYVEVGFTGKGGLGYISSLVEILRFDH
jgi:PhoPQ-activated pathogenicity-related protein